MLLLSYNTIVKLIIYVGVFLRSSIKLAIFSSFVIVYLCMKFQIFMKTTYLISFFSDNMMALFVSLLFINASALGIVLLESSELVSSNISSRFSKTTKQIMLSLNKQISLINKQIVLVSLSIIFLIYFDSIFLQNHQEYILFINITIVLFFMYEITILYDTVKSVFVEGNKS